METVVTVAVTAVPAAVARAREVVILVMTIVLTAAGMIRIIATIAIFATPVATIKVKLM